LNQGEDTDGVEDPLDNAVGGAVKLTSLVGALVKNRDETKGCAEEFRVYTWDFLGREVTFPDTSNVRYCRGGRRGLTVVLPEE